MRWEKSGFYPEFEIAKEKMLTYIDDRATTFFSS
jgi:hypothetical protein